MRIFVKTLLFLVLSLFYHTCGKVECLGCRNYPKASVCPSNYVYVPGDSVMGTSDFCVAKYEMKLDKNLGGGIEPDGNSFGGWSSGWIARSDPSGKPWGRIDQLRALSSCNSLDDGTYDYHLITNNEWQSIARNVENVDSNWTAGEVGSGCLYRGNCGTNDACGYASTSTIAERVTDTDPKAKLILSNGEEIWDLAGNLSEWVDYDSDGNTDSISYTGPGAMSDHELNSTEAVGTFSGFYNGGDSLDLTSLAFQPSNKNYTSTEGMGKIYILAGSQTAMALVRGGYNNDDEKAGVFSASLYIDSTLSDTATGFRCATSPEVLNP